MFDIFIVIIRAEKDDRVHRLYPVAAKDTTSPLARAGSSAEGSTRLAPTATLCDNYGRRWCLAAPARGPSCHWARDSQAGMAAGRGPRQVPSCPLQWSSDDDGEGDSDSYEAYPFYQL
jgi:hypothetical protein